jgi:hypothetical protein
MAPSRTSEDRGGRFICDGARKRCGCAGQFPDEFLFALDAGEKMEVVTICDHLHQLKYSRTLPTAFTEHGAIMAATVLKSKRAAEMSVFIVRAFVELREMLARNRDLSRKLAELERKISRHDKEIVSIAEAAWLQEIDRRARELDAGAVQTIPWEIARERLLRAPRD